MSDKDQNPNQNPATNPGQQRPDQINPSQPGQKPDQARPNPQSIPMPDKTGPAGGK